MLSEEYKLCRPMKRIVLPIALLMAATACAPKVVSIPETGVKPELVMKIQDKVFYHNVGITFDGKYYYTVNGGNEDYGKVNQYDAGGKLIASADVKVDGRAIFYNPSDGKIYIKTYMRDLLVYDPKRKEVKTVAEGVFHDNQSSPALDPSGKRIYELVEGTLYVMEFPSMKDIQTIEGLPCGEFPYSVTIAASKDFLFTWDEDGNVHVLDKNGKELASFKFKRTFHGMSLSWANGMLWAAEDADASDYGGVGTWFGYTLGPGIK
jgi:DNA-binding beta-propeller fold protein YncE